MRLSPRFCRFGRVPVATHYPMVTRGLVGERSKYQAMSPTSPRANFSLVVFEAREQVAVSVEGHLDRVSEHRLQALGAEVERDPI